MHVAIDSGGTRTSAGSFLEHSSSTKSHLLESLRLRIEHGNGVHSGGTQEALVRTRVDIPEDIWSVNELLTLT